ncbi:MULTISPECIES: hypothetical protein [Burkholderia]|uniref:hypothetical protein n=1 Tax=Burkholderia TaxID=32008 RepID=UPI000486B8A0|nr:MULTISPECIES: hypothetical protein [Burkholderia]
MTGIIVRVTPLATPAIADVRWDEDSFTLSCGIRYAPDNQPARPTMLRDRLDGQFGIPSDAPRIIIAGTLTLTLDRASRLSSLDFYTNVDYWRKVDTLPPIPVSPRTPSFWAEFDAFGRASAPEPAVGLDRASQCIYLIWRDDASVRYTIGPNVSVAAASDGSLARIELAGISPF